MISVFQNNVLNPVQLYFGSSKREACMVADPDEFIWQYRSSAYSVYDGTYYIDGQSIADANYVFHDALGQNRFYSPGVGNPKIADNIGNCALIKNAHTSAANSYLDNKSTWAIQEEDYNTQIILISANTTSTGYPRGYGSMYHSNPTLIDVSQPPNYMSMTKYRTGKFFSYGSKSQYAVDMGIVGNIKSGISTSESASYPSGYHGNTSANTSIRTDFDIYAANGVSNYTDITRYNVQLMYLTPAQMTAGDASVAATNYYVQYETIGGYNRPNGAFAQWLHPRHGPGICTNTALNGIYHHGFTHSYEQQLGALLGTFNSRLLIKSTTPSATGGADNGNGDIGWYKNTGGSTVWTYFSGAKWTIDKTL